MIPLNIIVDRIKNHSGHEHVVSVESDATIRTNIGNYVIVSRGKHEGFDADTSTVYNQPQASRIAVATYATGEDFAALRNKMFAAMTGFYVPFYQRRFEYEDGEYEGVDKGVVKWVDIFRVDWVWDARDGGERV